MSGWSSITRPVRQLGAKLPRWPWYTWAGLGVGAVILLGGAGTAAGATGPSAEPPPPRPAGNPPTIKLGSVGPWVTYLQGQLSITQTGVFDDATHNAVKAFQAQMGLDDDGVVGKNTWGALGVIVDTPATSPEPGPTPGPAPAPAPSPGNVFGLDSGIANREAQILAFIAQGAIDHQWVPLAWTKNGHSISVLVSRRALALSDGVNRLPVSLSFNNAQKAADLMGGVMLTTRVADEIQKQATTKLAPITHSWDKDGTMSKTSRMIEQGAIIDQQVGDASGIVSNEGKDWVLTRRFWLPPEGTGVEAPQGAKGSRHNSGNFGWYLSSAGSKSPGGMSVIQSIGLTHDRNHVDYCLAAGTLIDTPIGYVPIEGMKTGDLVFTYNRAKRRPDCSRIAGTKYTGILPTMVVVLDNGKRVRCTENHRWLLVDGQECISSKLYVGARLLPLRRSFAGAGYETLYSRSSHVYSYTHRVVGLAASRIENASRNVLVHHIDGNKGNNLPSNLEVVSHGQHAQEHDTAARCADQWKDPKTRDKMSSGISRAMRGRRFAPRILIKCSGCNKEIELLKSMVRCKKPCCSRKCAWAVRRGEADLNHVVVAIEKDGLSVPTFDLEVERDANFALAAGIFVHNSQLVRFMNPNGLFIDGVPHDLGNALSDPALSVLLQDEGGTLPGTRHPDL